MEICPCCGQRVWTAEEKAARAKKGAEARWRKTPSLDPHEPIPDGAPAVDEVFPPRPKPLPKILISTTGAILPEHDPRCLCGVCAAARA
jgi:hypothetical protein